MSNPYVLAGYLAAAFILSVYIVYLRRRGRVLTRALAGRARAEAVRPPPGPAPRGEGSEGTRRE